MFGPLLIGKTDPPEFVAYEETMLREPRLLVPGMQPNNNVKIDRTNRYAKNLKFIYLFQSNTNAHLHISGTNRRFVTAVSGSNSTITNGLNGVFRASSNFGGVTARISGDVRTGAGQSFYAGCPETLYWSTDSTICIGVNLGATNANSSNDATSFRAVSGPSNVYISIKENTSTWDITASTRAIDYTQSYGTFTFSKSNTNVFITFTKTGTSMWKGYVNGILTTFSSSLENPVGIYTSAVMEGFTAGSEYTVIPKIWYAAIWNRVLTNEEIYKLRLDPYQFLIPA